MTKKLMALGPLQAAIGEEAARIVGGNPDGLFIYAEVQPGIVSAAVFKDDGTSVRYFDPSSDLVDAISDAWYAEDEDKRWSVLEYDIRGNHFDAKFKFPDEVDVTSFDLEPRERALIARYGNRPIIYPPVPKGFSPLP